MLSFIGTFMAAQLFQQICPQKSFRLPDMQRCLAQIETALGFASGSTVLHQTVSPANVCYLLHVFTVYMLEVKLFLAEPEE